MKKLTERQKKALDLVLRSGISEGFYLAGGTALLIKYNHRYSEDFDFFTRDFLSSHVEVFLKKVSHITQIEVVRVAKEMVELSVEGVKFSFFGYPYDLLRPTEEVTAIPNLKLASDEDIAAMKAVAVAQRGDKKDFYDLWFLMGRRGWKMEDILGLCVQKYGNIFSPSHFLKAVVYFEDAERRVSSEEIEEHWQEVKRFFQEQVIRAVIPPRPESNPH